MDRVADDARAELQADCMAGTWAFSVAQHHGTPEERRDALPAGFDSGDPSICERFLPS